MSFSGKKFRRVRSENIEEIVKATSTDERVIHMLTSNAPIFSFTRIDEDHFNFTLQMSNRTMTHDFKLGEEHEMERRDGSKVRLTYTLEGDNVLKQVIIPKDGRVAYFRRDFGEKEAKMTITMEGTDIKATVYYEQVE
ncbi:fatty acid-binding protein, liver-like [Spodoptera litura]|uniref:Fatty acid-binding protein, liver-like n=1 Tax=Spodoptera litura TaxID=69820 RepID=A0A9J7EN32_SPOLT|nr:fatty acid-binding protein, liver-like [Spodoptera litura]